MNKIKRNLADELANGIKEMHKHDTGKLTLRTYKVENELLPEKQISGIRSKSSAKNRPALKSVIACLISSCVFITNGP